MFLGRMILANWLEKGAGFTQRLVETLKNMAMEKISTCRVNGISALAYLKIFFREVVKGCRDYENLLPMTIGINTNKL